ncbi:CPBP family intramembrane glutamic endopeptidase [Kineococcus sp. SYSU DK006]|uniref:CPBP family intramembrane glutamic endopeptidase n=1 Tax=Kineococcus sp. SYSU DK006 TaxID=3383127 RepID=UPI003D7DE1AB
MTTSTTDHPTDHPTDQPGHRPAHRPADRPYTALLRDDRHRWWRPLVGLAAAAGGLLVLLVVLLAGTVVAVLAAAALGRGEVPEVDDAQFDVALTSTWWGWLLTNLLLATGIPLAALAVLAGHRRRPGTLSSTAGRFRWRRTGAAALAALVVLGALVALGYAVDPVAPPADPVAREVVLLLLVVLLTTPLQAAGEEYVFRGWLSQAVGSWSARPVVGAVVAAVVSAALFGLAHGGQDAWLLTDRVVFGLVASWLVWRTGGLEAAVAVHAVNNLVILVPAVLTGTLAQASLATSAPPWVVLSGIAGLLLVAAVVHRTAPPRTGGHRSPRR